MNSIKSWENHFRLNRYFALNMYEHRCLFMLQVDLSLPSYEDAAIAAACVAAASAAASGTIDVHEQFENQGWGETTDIKEKST